MSEGADGKIFTALSERTEQVKSRMRTDNATIGSRLDDCATNLADSATTYRGTDHTSAQKLDSRYHPTGIPTADDDNEAAPAGTDPTSALTTPSGDSGLPDLINTILSQTSWFSISGVVFDSMKLFGFDPLGDLDEWLLGDVQAVGRVSNAQKAHSEFDAQCAGVITAGLSTLQASWTGNAATAAAGYFDDLADALSERSSTLRELGTLYSQFVAAVEELAATLSDTIQMVIDAALSVVAAPASAGCLASIPGVNAIAAIVGA